MKKQFLSILGAVAIALFLNNISWASTCDADNGTDVFGPIWQNTTWTKQNSPYCITQNVIVFENVTLSIEPGVTVKFWEGINSPLTDKLNITINGQLIAQGSKSEPIIFTSSLSSPNLGDWGYIEFTGKSKELLWAAGKYQQGSRLKDVVFEYGGGGNKAAISADVSPLINHIVIRYAKTRALYFKKSAQIYVSEFRHNVISGANALGGVVYAEEGLYLFDTIFSDNTILPSAAFNSSGWLESFGGVIYAGGNLTVEYSTFKNNLIKSLHKQSSLIGGTIYAKAVTRILNSVFSNNKFSTSCGGSVHCISNGGAVYAENTLDIVATKFENNTSQGDASGGAIYAGNRLDISDSSFSNNSSSWKGGVIYAQSPTVISNSIFSNNSVSHNLLYEQALGGAIYAEDTLEISNSTFNDNVSSSENGSSWGGAVYVKGVLTVSDSTFTDNSSTGINSTEPSWGGAIFSKARTNISNSIFNNNAVFSDRTSFFSSDRIYPTRGGAIACNNSIKVSNCKFTNNSSSSNPDHKYNFGGAIISLSTEAATIVHSQFFNNSSSTGSAIYSYVAIISDSDFTYNVASSTCISSGDLSLSNSLIYRNTGRDAMHLYSGSIIDSTIADNYANGIWVESSLTISQSNIFGNNTYDLYNGSKKPITANGNYWGTTNPSDIFAKIYDKYDDVNTGEVVFGLIDKTYLTEFAPNAPTVPIAKGDVNGDDIVNYGDALLAIKVASMKISPIVKKGSDVNGDGKIGIEDAIYILRKQ